MLAKPHRITEAGDFAAVVRRGERRGGTAIVVHSRATDPSAPARFGFVVSKAVGGAVQRNLVKRRLRSLAGDRIREGFGGSDVVVRALPASASADYRELDAQLQRGLNRR